MQDARAISPYFPMRVNRTVENLIGAFATISYCVFSKASNVSSLLWLAIWSCPAAAFIAHLYSLQIGSMEVRPSGILNVMLFTGGLIVVGANVAPSWRQAKNNFKPFVYLVGFATVRLLDAPDKLIAARELLLFAIPLVIAIAAEVALDRGLNPRWIESQLMICPLFTVVVLLMQALYGTIGYDEGGLATILGKGPIALLCLPIFSLALSRWRYDISKAWSRYAAALSLGLILVTVERMASVVAVFLLLPLRFVSFKRRPVISLFVGAAAASLVALLLLQVPTVKYRFFEDKEAPVFAREESVINTTGRLELWYVTLEDALEKPFLGHGTGSSEVLIPIAVPGLDHPHEEYLRVYHDLGVIGLGLFLWAWFGRLAKHLRLWHSLDHSPQFAQPHMAAGLATAALMLSYFTDNALVATFVQIPAFLLFAIADKSSKVASSR